MSEFREPGPYAKWYPPTPRPVCTRNGEPCEFSHSYTDNHFGPGRHCIFCNVTCDEEGWWAVWWFGKTAFLEPPASKLYPAKETA